VIPTHTIDENYTMTPAWTRGIIGDVPVYAVTPTAVHSARIDAIDSTIQTMSIAAP
jgi:hypothetical protein